MRPQLHLMGLLATVLALSACGEAAAPVSSSAPSSPSVAASVGAASSAAAKPSAASTSGSASAAAAGQVALSQWEKDTLAAALKEGKVTVYGFWDPVLEKAVTDVMTARYPGLKLETLTSTTAVEKIRTETQAGQPTADVYLGGQNSGYQLSQLGLSSDFKPPAETEAGAKWNFPPSSYASYPQVVYAVQGKGLMINTQKVPADKEPKLWKDLLDPFWSGKKLGIDDPTQGSGPGVSWARWIDETPELGRSYLQGLIKQDLVLTNSTLAPAAVARGEYYGYIPAFPSYLQQVKGAPVKFIWLGPSSGSAVGSIAVLLKNAPHPNAAKLWINMLLTDQMQKVLADVQWVTPNKVGVPLADPIISFEGHNVTVDNEDQTKRTPQWAQTVGRQLFAH